MLSHLYIRSIDGTMKSTDHGGIEPPIILEMTDMTTTAQQATGRTVPESASVLLREFEADREHGLTYREIGERHGLSHERVRQVLVDGKAPARDRNWAAEYRKDTAAAEIAEWLNQQGPTTSDKVREQFGLNIQQLSELMGHGIPRHLVLAGRGRTGSAYNTDDLVAAVTRSWQRYRYEVPAAEKFSVTAYEKHRLPEDPSLALITSRVPWKQVCEQAGIPCSKGRGDYKRTWEDGDLLNWVGRYLEASAEADERVTFYGYDRWRKGREGAPSGALLRTRLRRSGYATWGEMVAAAASKDR